MVTRSHGRRAGRRGRDDEGASSVELVLYMPLLIAVMLIVVQGALIWYGNHVASAVARETARIARVYDDPGRARLAGHQYADNLADGALQDVRITVEPIGGDRVRITVSGEAQELVKGLIPRVEEVVVGPLEDADSFEDSAP